MKGPVQKWCGSSLGRNLVWHCLTPKNLLDVFVEEWRASIRQLHCHNENGAMPCCDSKQEFEFLNMFFLCFKYF
jgi:hypothetical protein